MSREGWGQGYHRGGPNGWVRLLVPLVIGVALGALLFGGPRFAVPFAGGYSAPQLQVERRLESQRYERQAPVPDQRSADEYAFGRGRGYGPYGPGWHHGGFGFFGLGRLLLPLLLIGAGVWLFNRRRGPGSQGGQGGHGESSRPVGPAPEPPLPPSDRPSTSDTTRL